MSSLLIGIIGVALSTNQPAALSNVVADATALHISFEDPETELERIMAQDDATHDLVDSWIRENKEFEAKGAPIPAGELNLRIMKRMDALRAMYIDFINRHTNYAAARIAYASFLDGIGEEDAQVEQLLKARELEPTNPAAWNQLANYYGHNGELTNAFTYYTRASELDPTEPVYYWNFATTVYLYRRDVMDFYHITEPQVFDKSLALYAKALSLDPTNFVLATDLAESYYGIRPMRTNDALLAWTNALRIAHTDLEREGVAIHQARVKTYIGLYDQSRAHLNLVTNDIYKDLKARLLKNLNRLENESRTNALSSNTTTSTLTNGPNSNP